MENRFINFMEMRYARGALSKIARKGLTLTYLDPEESRFIYETYKDAIWSILGDYQPLVFENITTHEAFAEQLVRLTGEIVAADLIKEGLC